MPSYQNQPPDSRYLCPYCGTTVSNLLISSRIRCQNMACQEIWYPCGNYNHGIRMVQVRGNSIPRCRECVVDNGFYRCVTCEQYSRSYGYDVGGGIHCEPCVNSTVECADCDQPLQISNTQRDNGERICHPCYLLRLSDREDGRILRGACSCPDCFSERQLSRRNDPAYLHSWDYRPNLVFHGNDKKKDRLFLGMELELETGMNYDACSDVVRKHLTEVPNLAFLKNDGSIQCGFELVTHPMTYEWANDHFPWEMISELADKGAYSTDRVGMHVHLSRRGFTSPAHIYKWMKFIYRNSAQVIRIARRESFDWAAFDPEDRANIKYFCKGEAGHARYRAINTLNNHTFEVRVFRSSTRVQEIKAALALSDASARYTEKLTTSDILSGGWEWSRFAEWVSENPIYAPLSQEMEVQGCVS